MSPRAPFSRFFRSSASCRCLGAALALIFASSAVACASTPDDGALLEPAPSSDDGVAVDAGGERDAPVDSGGGPSSAPLDAGRADAHAGKTTDAGAPLPKPIPALSKCMSAKPYVEGTCTPTTFAGWPHPALACTYASPIGQLSVTVADPTADQVAIWIADAGDSIPAIAHLKTSDPTSYLAALQRIAAALMIQSSRIFPLSGAVGEDQGDGYYPYPFHEGVSDPCPSGEPHCYCRINSLSRGDFCAYRVAQGLEAESACRARVGYGGGSTSAWQDECMKNHATSWGAAANPHIRAQVWAHLRDEGIGPTASGASVVGALDQAYGLSASTVRSFCN